MRVRAPRWVSKTDVARYIRCPYAFWLVDSGQAQPEEMLGAGSRELIERGRAFEEIVTKGVPPLALTKENMQEVLASDILLHSPPPFENRRLYLHGQPDAIWMAKGALIPAEIKSHRRPSRLDRIELAFYWRLLEPHRSRMCDPFGVLFLPDEDDRPRRVEVKLKPSDFEEIESICREIRRARKYGIQPELCDCAICLGRSEILESVQSREGLTLLYGVGRPRATALSKLGVRTLTHIENCDPVKVSLGLRQHKQYVGPPTVFGWQLQAKSYRLGRPLRLREDKLPFSKFVAIDLEYDSIKSGLVWLIGFAVIDGSELRVVQLWADNSSQERRNIERLIGLIAEQDVHVITWSGCTAEIPTLRKAAFRSGISIVPLVERHLDLFRYIDRNYRFPTKWLGLKSLGNFLGLDRGLEVTGGFEAQMLWQEYQRTSGVAKKRIKQELLIYNRDDLRVLAEIAKGLQAEGGLLAGASSESSF